MSDEIRCCNSHNHIACAKRIPIFSSLNHEELEQVVSLIIQKRYHKDELIISEGSVPQDLIIVSRGRIKVYSYSEDGREYIMYILTDGDFYGVRNLVREETAGYNAKAMEDTIVCTIEKQKFRDLVIKYPMIGIKVMEDLCNRLEKMEMLFRKISPKDVDSRINMMLLELLEKYGTKNDKGYLVDLPMSREEMAGYIGVARETVSRKLNALRDEGIIDIIGNRKILILDEDALTQ